jgi:hypothetical protein
MAELTKAWRALSAGDTTAMFSSTPEHMLFGGTKGWVTSTPFRGYAYIPLITS